MAFGAGGGGGSSISSSSDTALSNPTKNDVLTFNDTTAKWTNTPLAHKLDTSHLTTMEGIAIYSGQTGWPARPTGFARVRWVGGVSRPSAMIAGDVWEHDA